MSGWTKVTLTKDKALMIFERNITYQDNDEVTWWDIALERWLEKWFKDRGFDRVKMRTIYKRIPTPRAGIGRHIEVDLIHLKFKKPEDAMIFRLTL